MLGGSGVMGSEYFTVDMWLGKIGNVEESLGILVFNSYVIGEQIVRGPVVARLGGMYEVGHLMTADERRERGCEQHALTMTRRYEDNPDIPTLLDHFRPHPIWQSYLLSARSRESV